MHVDSYGALLISAVAFSQHEPHVLQPDARIIFDQRVKGQLVVQEHMLAWSNGHEIMK